MALWTKSFDLLLWREGWNPEKRGLGYLAGRMEPRFILEGPKARLIPAWGSAPRDGPPFGTALKARLIPRDREGDADESGLQPWFVSMNRNLGRWPRLGWDAPLALWTKSFDLLFVEGGMEP